MKREVSLVIADDHPIFRRGLRALLDADPHLKVVGEAEDGEAALAAIQEHHPDVVILDIDMPPPDGLAVARTLREQRLSVAVIFLTMHKDEPMFNSALDLGAKGYVLKDGAVNEIVGCVNAVAAGQMFISPPLAHHLINRRDRTDALTQQRPGVDNLTPAERRVLRLIAESKTNKQIADELFISARTVEHHRAHICEKLGLKGTHALLSFAIQHKSEL